MRKYLNRSIFFAEFLHEKWDPRVDSKFLIFCDNFAFKNFHRSTTASTTKLTIHQDTRVITLIIILIMVMELKINPITAKHIIIKTNTVAIT